MSLLSSYLSEHLLLVIETEFEAHEPELQAKLLAEVKIFSERVGQWINNKLLPKAE
jgi:hypothetical protein